MGENNSTDPGGNQYRPFDESNVHSDPYKSGGAFPGDRPEPFGSPGGYSYTPMPAAPEMSVKDWFITLLILSIPCVNIIMLFLWAFSSDGNRTRSNYCKANLLIVAVMVVLSIVLSGVIGSIMAFAIGEFGSFYY